MVKTKFHYFFTAILLFPLNISAAPIFEDSLIYTTILETDNYTSQYSSNSYFSRSSDDGTGFVYGDLMTGKAGAKSSDAQSIVSVYDTLTFSSAATVSFEYTFDGFLSSFSQFNNTYGQGRVDIYDISGLSHWIETESLFGLVDIDSVVEEADVVSTNNISINMDRIRGFTTSGGEFEIANLLSRDGTLFDVAHTVSGSFNVDPNRLYGIRFTANANGFGDGGIADFSETGTFSFTDLGGSSFTSASGVFLNNNATLVSSSGSIALFMLGCGALVRVRLKKFS